MVETGETRFQTLAGRIGSGFGLRLTQIGVCVFFVFALFFLYASLEFRGFTNAEAMDYAQIARNVASGKGFSTKCIRPVDAWYLQRNGRKASVEKYPEIRHGPMFPLVLALGLRALPSSCFDASEARVYLPERLVVVPMCQFFAMGGGLFLFLLGKRLFGRRVAVLAAVAYFVGEPVLADSISGLPLSFLTFLVTGASYFAVVAAARRNEDEPFVRWAMPGVVSALLCVAAFLTRYSAVVVVPMLAVYLCFALKRHGRNVAIIYVLVFLAGIAPWLVRNQVVSGGMLGIVPYRIVEETDVFQGDAFERSLLPSLDPSRLSTAVKAKFLSNFDRPSICDLRALGSGLFVCFFLVSFFHGFMLRDVHVFRWCVALAMLLMAGAGAACGGTTLRLMNVFLPMVLLYGAAFLLVMLERLRLDPPELDTAITSFVVFLSALPLAIRLIVPGGNFPYPPYFPPFVSHVCNMIGRQELICSDIPWATAWYGNRTSVLLPATLDDFYKINDSIGKISGLYLTTQTGDKPYTSGLVDGSDRSWLPILNGKIPPDFPFAEGIVLPPGGHDQIFLTDSAHLHPPPIKKDSSPEVLYH